MIRILNRKLYICSKIQKLLVALKTVMKCNGVFHFESIFNINVVDSAHQLNLISADEYPEFFDRLIFQQSSDVGTRFGTRFLDQSSSTKFNKLDQNKHVFDHPSGFLNKPGPSHHRSACSK